jgi:hypothetical protein
VRLPQRPNAMAASSHLPEEPRPDVYDADRSEATVVSVGAAVGPPPFHGNSTRVNAALLWQLLGVCIMLFAYCWLYVGVSWSPLPRLPALKVALLSCDAGVPAPLAPALPPALSTGPPIGQQLLNGSLFSPASPVAGLLGFYWHACAAARGASSCASVAAACRNELLELINDGKAWSALYIPPDFTAAVLSNAPAFHMNATQPTVEHIFSSGASCKAPHHHREMLTAVLTLPHVLCLLQGGATRRTPASTL